VLRDISKARRSEEILSDAKERLARVVMQDSLTGLPNRACFLETAERLLGRSTPLAVLIIDLDRFKPINDVHGHAVGDALLREVAARLAEELAGEPIVARLGADEFAALLRVEDGDSGISARVRDLLRVIADPIEVGAMTLDVNATVGISVSPRDGGNVETVLRTADIAMAEAKHAGGGCYRFFERRMGEELILATELKGELRAAIAAGEVVPYFQPLVRLADATVVGFEVLARWEHPVKGLLPPVLFLPLVEEMGLSAAMFGTMLSQVCAAVRAWPPHIRFSVNISPHELQDESLPDDVRAILESHGVPGHQLEIEITENALIHDSRIARGVINRLRDLGLTVALDDFGTGFSSLYHLRELPFDKVKIDKSFMRALGSDAESARYVAAIIGLGQALGLELTAEGVEDTATMVRLQELGCTYGQGYLFGKPTPVAEAAALVRAGSVVKVLAAE
jgi:diguanylate cyclase (GGDEF)-like protein